MSHIGLKSFMVKSLKYEPQKAEGNQKNTRERDFHHQLLSVVMD